MARKPKEPPKRCMMCNECHAIQGEKYCKTCKTSVLNELTSTGYLTDTTPSRSGNEQRGRKAMNSVVMGGAAEHGTDGDDW